MFMRKALIAAVAIALSTAANATDVDLTTAGSTGTVNGALFFQIDAQSTGTGVIDPFVQLDDNDGDSNGYNTTVNSVLDNGAADNFNHELLLTSVPVVNIGGVDYREFLLDINETGEDPFVSLHEIQLFTSDTANQSVETFTGGILDLADATLIYDLDALEDSVVELNYSLNTGSGSGDVLFYVPDSLFTGTGDFVYLYSAFGSLNDEEAGFEEWAIVEGGLGVVPEPATVVLLGLGLAAAAARQRFARKS